MPRKMKNYEEELSQRLKNPKYAAEYLNAVLMDKGDDLQERFLLALRDVAQAHGIKSLAHEADIAREALYRVLSGNGNPELATLLSLLNALGIRMTFTAGKAS